MPKVAWTVKNVLDDYVTITAHCSGGAICQDCVLRLLKAGMEKWGGLVLENGEIRFQRRAGEIDG